ncbi:MAG: PilZ domain-containing protein [Phycisphaeraceae bacterium]|nr:PilZ domain-containing protein [Phycisphaeraceae bacterium]
MAVSTNELHPISLWDLSLGQVLHGNLCDKNGKIVLPAGCRLGETEYNALRQQKLFVGNDWFKKASSPPATAEPQKIIQDLGKQHTQQASPNDRREHKRFPWSVALTMQLEESGGNHRRIEVTTLNISVGGFAFTYRQFIHPGTIVFARFETLPDKPVLKGVVRSCAPIGGMQHRIGVQFLENTHQAETPDNPPKNPSA